MSLLTIEDAVKDESLVRQYINQRWADAFVQHLGYVWASERIERIAVDMSECMKNGAPASWALVFAYDLELIMYGTGETECLPMLKGFHGQNNTTAKT